MKKYVDVDLINDTKYIAFRFDLDGKSLSMISIIIQMEYGNGEAYFNKTYEGLCNYFGSTQVTYNEDSFNAKWELLECNTNLILSDFGDFLTLSMFDKKIYS